jgi:hypothetical protein
MSFLTYGFYYIYSIVKFYAFSNEKFLTLMMGAKFIYIRPKFILKILAAFMTRIRLSLTFSSPNSSYGYVSASSTFSYVIANGNIDASTNLPS